jgi:hypothetical protein
MRLSSVLPTQLAVLLLVSVPASADIIVLHNTGESLTMGDRDPNSTVVLPDGNFFGQVISATNSATDPESSWIVPAPGNTWISTAELGNIATWIYKYSTTFVIGPRLDPSTAQLSGYWWADDAGFNHDGIYYNGIYLNVGSVELRWSEGR